MTLRLEDKNKYYFYNYKYWELSKEEREAIHKKQIRRERLKNSIVSAIQELILIYIMLVFVWLFLFLLGWT